MALRRPRWWFGEAEVDELGRQSSREARTVPTGVPKVQTAARGTCAPFLVREWQAQVGKEQKRSHQVIIARAHVSGGPMSRSQGPLEHLEHSWRLRENRIL